MTGTMPQEHVDRMANVRNLPNDCGLVAVRRAWQLYREQIECRLMSVRMPEGDYHCYLIYQFPGAEGEMFAYDGNGTTPLGRCAWSRGYIAQTLQPGCSDPTWVTA
jgi:hypothetical protein